MFKKISFIAVAMTTSLLAMETDEFNPETASFSQMETLKTWVSSTHHPDIQKMKAIQRNVAMEVPENPYSLNFVRPIRNNEGDSRYFGKTFYTFKSAQLPFLQFVHELSKTKNPIVLEIAASYGLVTWKVPYAFENSGTVYANELSSTMLSNEFDVIINKRLKDNNLDHLVHKIPGDCFNIISEHSELIGQVDAIYVQNLEHFFNPIQHQEFLKLLSTLLTGSGRAFLAAHTIQLENVLNKTPVYNLYVKDKTTVMYPGFMRTIGVSTSLESGATVGKIICLEATRPDDSTLCETKTLEILSTDYVLTPQGMKKAYKLKQEVIDHFFTPTIYKSAIVPHESLKMVETFFMDNRGNKYEKYNTTQDMSHAVAIIEKQG